MQMRFPVLWPALLTTHLSLGVVSAVHAVADTWCRDGMALPNFTQGEIVEVLYAQAPLFSINPKVGADFGMINLYHTSIVLAQGADKERRYWTLEYGVPLSYLDRWWPVAPQLVPNHSALGNMTMTWHNDNKYCLTYGLLHGRAHWSTHLDIVMSVSVDEAVRAFNEFVGPMNNFKPGEGPQYTMFKVAHAGFFGRDIRVFIDDLTCNHGSVWFIHYLNSITGTVPPDFELKGTIAVMNALDVKRVDPSDHDKWNDMLNFWKALNDIQSSNRTLLSKFVDILEVFKGPRYQYDFKSSQYFEVVGNKFPFVWFQYGSFPLSSPGIYLPNASHSPSALMV